MTRHFDEQLQELFRKIVMMGSLTETMIQSAVAGLVTRNEARSIDVFAKEHDVNALQVEVDELAVKLTALQQPVASDARFLFMASRIGGELERIADQAVNICQNTKFVLKSGSFKAPVDLPIMAEIAQKMVRDSLTAMINRDVALAHSVLEEENKVDAFRDRIFKMLLDEMVAAQIDGVSRDVSLILIARNLERIGDHATNVAEEVIYWINGRDIRHGNAKFNNPASSTSTPAKNSTRAAS